MYVITTPTYLRRSHGMPQRTIYAVEGQSDDSDRLQRAQRDAARGSCIALFEALAVSIAGFHCHNEEIVHVARDMTWRIVLEA